MSCYTIKKKRKEKKIKDIWKILKFEIAVVLAILDFLDSVYH